MVDWGRLLSGCRGLKPRPQVRILSSPLINEYSVIKDMSETLIS